MVWLMVLFIKALLFFSQSLYAQSACPANYVVFKNICVAKYEMKKNKDKKASSEAKNRPWVEINQKEALKACQDLGHGYDLISNAQWTEIARDISHTQSNWNTGVPFKGTLNIGHSDGVPDRALEASSNDDEACYLTGQSCSSLKWNLEKRTHKLSNGETIWDFSGNVAEWVKDINDKKQIEAPQMYVSLVDFKDVRYASFGPDQKCETPQIEYSYCGLGYYWTHDVKRNGIGRSGFWKHKSPFMTGIFSLGVDVFIDKRYPFMGFRCVYTPAQNRTHF